MWTLEARSTIDSATNGAHAATATAQQAAHRVINQGAEAVGYERKVCDKTKTQVAKTVSNNPIYTVAVSAATGLVLELPVARLMHLV
jgi:ElaB/YqjD/DUF883 family membrane-anchored ribosome-binding protein